MDEPARKRRKTTSPGGRERLSSPLKQPPRRPSFASPTKASLARFNPNLLPPRPTSSDSAPSRRGSHGEVINRGKQARAFIFGVTEGPPGEEEADPSIATDEVATGAEQEAATRAQNTTPRPRRRGSRSRGALQLGDLREEEVDLPISPSAKAMEHQDTPRRGVLYSSPSKRPPRLREGAKPTVLQRKDPNVRRGRAARSQAAADDENQAENGHEKKRQPPDPEAEKKKREKDQLLQELRDLENDVAQCSSQIRKLQNSTRSQVLNPTERDELISLINKISGSAESTELSQPPPISSLLCSFLPFTAQTISGPQLKQKREDNIPSHRPLELDDPLPFLEMFTSFKFNSSVALPTLGDIDPTNVQYYRKHTIEVVGPQKLLASTIEFTIDSRTYEIANLPILSLSSWAERELGNFVQLKAQQKDLSCVCWALESYWELAKKRAEYWHKCETIFSHLMPGRTSDDTENFGQVRGKPSTSMSRRELLRNLGRDFVVLEDRHVLLKIIWRIGFDWTGEAETTIHIEPAFPAVWSEADGANSLKQVPETFNSLLESRGVFEATKVIVALLFSE